MASTALNPPIVPPLNSLEVDYEVLKHHRRELRAADFREPARRSGVQGKWLQNPPTCH